MILIGAGDVFNVHSNTNSDIVTPERKDVLQKAYAQLETIMSVVSGNIEAVESFLRRQKPNTRQRNFM